jgi:hypothetical protein
MERRIPRIERHAIIRNIDLHFSGIHRNPNAYLMAAAFRPCILDHVAHDLIERDLKLNQWLLRQRVLAADPLDRRTE